MRRSKSGIALRRHTRRATGVDLRDDPRLVKAIEEHAGRHFGPVFQRWRPADAADTPIYVGILEPTPERPALSLSSTWSGTGHVRARPDSPNVGRRGRSL